MKTNQWISVVFLDLNIWHLHYLSSCTSATIIDQVGPTLKNCFFPITGITKKKVTWVAGKTFFFTLFNMFKLNISCFFNCYLHHNCSININWNSTQLCSSAKPLCNVPRSVLWFVNFCLHPFLSRTSFQEWKRIWFCYVHKWIG